MKTKHTPGNWYVEEDGHAPYVCAPKAEGRVCTLEPTYGGKEKTTMRRNARLIAAAPKLLSALEAIAKLAGQSCNDFTDLDVLLDPRLIHQIACAAIAAATGEDQ
jgi:hypothetical protein